jgi:hypothetical protein
MMRLIPSGSPSAVGHSPPPESTQIHGIRIPGGYEYPPTQISGFPDEKTPQILRLRVTDMNLQPTWWNAGSEW